MHLLTLLAQAAPTQASPADPSADAPTIEIDPNASDAVNIVTPEAAETEPEVQGAVEQQLDAIIPESGNGSVDGAVNKLAEAVGGMVDSLIAMLPQLLIALLVLIAVAFLVRIADRVVLKLTTRAKLRESLRDLARIAVRVGLWFAGIMVAATIVFPSFGPGQLVATAGLASIAIGFAFQDIFENFFAGILILWNFPFENGDFIEVDGLMGRVEDVEIRMTRIRKPDGELVLVPNATIFKNKVTVKTNRRHRCIEVAVGIAYGEDVAEGRRVILEAVKGCDTVQSDAPPEVLASGFGASSIDFDVLWWCNATPIDERRSRDQVIEAIKKALDEAGIEIPYPYRTLTFSKNEPDIINAFAQAAPGASGGESDGQGNADG